MTRQPDIAPGTPGTPCQKMWERLNKVYGEDKAVAVAIEILRRNELNRKLPLLGVTNG